MSDKTLPIYAQPSPTDILLMAIASVKLSQPVLFHKSVSKWLVHKPVAATFRQLPCPPTHATFAVDRFVSRAPEGYGQSNPRIEINRFLHRYLSSAVSEVRGQLKCGNVESALNLWRFSLDECLKRFGQTSGKFKRPVLNSRLCQRLDGLVIKLAVKGEGLLIGEYLLIFLILLITNTGCFLHLTTLLTSDTLTSRNEERLVATYLHLLLPHLQQHLSVHPATPDLEAALRSALRWVRAYF